MLESMVGTEGIPVNRAAFIAGVGVAPATIWLPKMSGRGAQNYSSTNNRILRTQTGIYVIDPQGRNVLSIDGSESSVLVFRTQATQWTCPPFMLPGESFSPVQGVTLSVSRSFDNSSQTTTLVTPKASGQVKSVFKGEVTSNFTNVGYQDIGPFPQPKMQPNFSPLGCIGAVAAVIGASIGVADAMLALALAPEFAPIDLWALSQAVLAWGAAYADYENECAS